MEKYDPNRQDKPYKWEQSPVFPDLKRLYVLDENGTWDHIAGVADTCFDLFGYGGYHVESQAEGMRLVVERARELGLI